MKRRYIIAVDEPSNVGDAAFSEYVRDELKAQWWHWIRGFWIVEHNSKKTQLASITQKLADIYDCSCLVIEANGNLAWYGTGPDEAPHDMFAWLLKHIKPPSD